MRCFVCDKEGADQWLSELDIRVCSDRCMRILLEEWVKMEDPLGREKKTEEKEAVTEEQQE